jgi:hypothetical protein
MRRKILHCGALAGLCLLAMSAPGRSASALDVSEYQAKAVYLYNFISFFQWPSVRDRGFVIGIVGDDQFGAGFQEVENRPVKSTGMKLLIRRLGPYRPGMDLKDCNLLFIDSSEQKHARKIVGSVAGLPILTVSEIDGFIEGGGMINLIMVQDKLRWEINREALDRSGLKYHSMILQSAVRIFPQAQ